MRQGNISDVKPSKIESCWEKVRKKATCLFVCAVDLECHYVHDFRSARAGGRSNLSQPRSSDIANLPGTHDKLCWAEMSDVCHYRSQQ